MISTQSSNMTRNGNYLTVNQHHLTGLTDVISDQGKVNLFTYLFMTLLVMYDSHAKINMFGMNVIICMDISVNSLEQFLKKKLEM
jgi:hypothetical protein